MQKRISKKERYKGIVSYFESSMPVAETELEYQSPYQLLVAVILSAQCTDKRVNMLTPPFFKVFPDVQSLAKASVESVFELIKSCSYPNNKARHLVGMAQTLVNEFKGIVPSDIEELQKLPGVGRKTANVIASVAFNLPAMAVDTHVFRVSERLGLTTNSRSPYHTEMELIKYIPADKLAIAHHWLILHGRYVCVARKPKCDECGIKNLCRYYGSLQK